MYLMFDTIDSFNSWLSQVNTILEYPNSTNTSSYTELLATQNGEIICQIDDNCPAQLLNAMTVYDRGQIEQYLLNENMAVSKATGVCKAKFIVEMLNGEPKLTSEQIQYCVNNNVSYFTDSVIDSGEAELVITAPNEQVMNDVKATPELKFVEDLAEVY